MTRRVRLLLASVLALVLVATGSTAAWALWSTTGTTGSSVGLGTVSASVTGTSALTATFSAATASVTGPVTFTNSGTVAGAATTTVAVGSGGSTTLAQTVDVTAWPVATTDACTASATVGAGAVSGTWAALPSLSSSLAAGASTVWCVRSTPESSAPASSTVDLAIDLTVTTGSWTSGLVSGAFTLSTADAATATPAFSCTDADGNFVTLTWDVSARSSDTYYGAFVADTMVGDAEQGYYGQIPLAPGDIPTSLAPDGPTTVTIQVLEGADGSSTATVVASGTVTLFEQNDARAIRCGA